MIFIKHGALVPEKRTVFTPSGRKRIKFSLRKCFRNCIYIPVQLFKMTNKLELQCVSVFVWVNLVKKWPGSVQKYIIYRKTAHYTQPLTETELYQQHFRSKNHPENHPDLLLVHLFKCLYTSCWINKVMIYLYRMSPNSAEDSCWL